LLVAHQPLALGLAANTIGLGVDDAGGMRLDPDAEIQAQVEAFLVGQPELLGELVDTKFRCQSCGVLPFRGCRCPLGTSSLSSRVDRRIAERTS